jgi:hypothetical protein
MDIKKLASLKAKRYSAAEESLAEATQKLKDLIHEINSLDDKSLEELQQQLPDYGKLRNYIEQNMEDSYPISIKEIEGEEGLPLLFKALILTKVREMQAKVDKRLEESVSAEEMAELERVARQLSDMENLIYHNLKNLRRIDKKETRRTVMQKFLEQKGKESKDQLTPEELREFKYEFLPKFQNAEMDADSGFTDTSSRSIDVIEKNFEEAIALIENAADEIASYESFYSEIEAEASESGYVSAYRQISVPEGKSLDEFLSAKGTNIGRVWYKSEETAPPEDEEAGSRNSRTDTYILEAKIPKDSIDWKMMKNVYYSENGPNPQAVIGEIFVIKGAPVELLRIFKVSEEGDELEVPINHKTVRASDIADLIRIAERKFSEFTKNRKQGPLTEDRKSAPETPAGAAPETHAATPTKEAPVGVVALTIKKIKSRYGW